MTTMVERLHSMMQQPCTRRAPTASSSYRPQHDICINKKGSNSEAPLPPGCNAAMMLNHKAVMLLMSGCEEEKAMEILKLGLTCLKSKLATAPTSMSTLSSSLSECQQGDENWKDRQEVAPQRLAVIPPARCASIARILSIPVFQTRPLNDDDGFYLYTNAFTYDLSSFDEKRHSPLLSSMMDTEILSATIIFNLALALTTKAIRINSSSLLERSARLYEMSMGLLSSIIMSPRTDHQKETNLSCEFAWNVAVACSNNLGQLAFHQGNYERSQTMRSTMQYLLSMPLLARHESGVRPSRMLFNETDLRGFKLNIMFMFPPTSAPMA